MSKRERFTLAHVDNPIHAKAKENATTAQQMAFPAPSDVIRFFIPGIPKGEPRKLSRAIFSKKAGRHIGSVYPNSCADDWKKLVSIFAAPHRPLEPMEGPLSVTIAFYFPRPKSHYGTGRKSETMKPNAPYWHISTPDKDNCEKLILDKLTQLGFWNDDSQVCCGEVTKQYECLGGHPAGALVVIAKAC